jgi:hypothetical protein
MRFFDEKKTVLKEIKASWNEHEKLELELKSHELIVSASVNHCLPSDG